MPKVSALVLDLDGVLVDACEIHYHSLNESLNLLAGFEISRIHHEETYNGLPTKRKLDLLVAENRIQLHQIEPIVELKQQKTIDLIERTIHEDPCKIKMMEFLKERDIKIGCVTNSIRTTAELMLKRSGLFPFLDVFISNQDVTKPKPNPEGYKKAFKLLSTPPKETIVIEDSEIGFQAAFASGARVVRVSDHSKVHIDLIKDIIGD